MQIDVVTIFPDLVRDALVHGVIGRALEAGIAGVSVRDLRDYAEGRHRTTDDTPCGGGGGMVMKPDPIGNALTAIRAGPGPDRVILTDPQGEVFSQAAARRLSEERHLVFVCGRYEGVDERVREHLVTDAYSIGDYVLTGGELPALVMIDAIVRLLPGALGGDDAAERESFGDGLLDYPQYTRPRSYQGWDVPELLFSGRHADIERWRRWRRLSQTRERRPDLWARYAPSAEDELLLEQGEPS